MNKYMKVLVFAAIVALIVVPAQAAGPEVSPAICALVAKMQKVFKLLRILAFVGAGFYMAGWAWDYIVNAGKAAKDGGFSIDDVKKKGVGLLVGFTLLFIIGIVISVLLSATGEDGNSCIAKNW